MPQRAIQANFLFNFAWRDEVLKEGGFFDFEDGSLQCVMMINDFVSMRLIQRTSLEFFADTVKNVVSAEPRLKLVINGPYGDNESLSRLQQIAAFAHRLTPAGAQPLMGEVVEHGVKTLGGTEKNRAFLAFDSKNRTQSDVIFVGMGDPPRGVDVAIGGLGPLTLIGIPRVSDTNAWFQWLDTFPSKTGRTVVATSIATGLVMVIVQRDGSKPGLTLSQIRNKLMAADFENAVALDGSTSSMLFRNGVPRIPQSDFKDSVTYVGLGFFYEPGSLPSP